MRDDYPELLESVRAAVMGVLVDEGIDVNAAKKAGHAAAERVRRDCGGLTIYIPRGHAYELSQRDREIYAAWRPNENEAELCRQFRISDRHLRRVVEARRVEDRAVRQGSLGLDN